MAFGVLGVTRTEYRGPASALALYYVSLNWIELDLGMESPSRSPRRPQVPINSEARRPDRQSPPFLIYFGGGLCTYSTHFRFPLLESIQPQNSVSLPP